MNAPLKMIILMPLIICFTLSGQVPDGRMIMTQLHDRPDGDDFICNMRMTLTNKRGQTRVREMKIFSKDYGDDKKALTFFKRPADVRGTGFLSYDYHDSEKQDDRWLYLPALRKSKRISGSADNDRFMGSDFTYKDWGARDIDEDQHRLIKTEKDDEKLYWVVESVPLDESDPYGKFITWIDQESLIEKRIEFYDSDNHLLKVFELLDMKLIDGFWTPLSFMMKDVQRNHSTLIEQSEVKYNQNLQDSFFRVGALERGLIR